jgi:hypothetical protein
VGAPPTSAAVLDVYLGLLLPDRETIVFFSEGAGCVAFGRRS